MNFDKYRTQQLFETILKTHYGKIDFKNVTESEIKNYNLTNSAIALLRQPMNEDAIDLYFKGYFTLLEAINNISTKRYTWATIKAYYALFYLVRSELLLGNIVFFRKYREAFFTKCTIGQRAIKLPKENQSDHLGSFYLIKNYIPNTYLNTNNINDKDVYSWMRDNREIANYKHREFYEPDIPSIWEEIDEIFNENGLSYLINYMYRDGLNCFMESRAILAAPLKQLNITFQKFIDSGIVVTPKHDKKIIITNSVNALCKESFLNQYIEST